ncbi:hypothetical protein GL325_09170 [Aeromicrobium sp. 636]|uniref:Branched-chain amino acid ABC transporter permease n=1 Tax=Aeromicrobium senzhongii TaxID=2663859 RepID=A0A8I0K0L1_9ACTN|nr:MULTISPECIES: branched-chain amino acid ABC transporter permease [Aeromicrobium]MBC9226491.1 branched-chain amino acid ABC transporter permease [Aeromicrobium senzhongii]MCQ3998595.1 hypothetical protein [Aeromicrobium sp. 636]
MTQAILSGVGIGALYVLMSIGFALELKIADIVNAAHGVFVVLGMYVTLVAVQNDVPVVMAIVLATLAVGLLSYPIYTILIRSAKATSGHRVQLVFTLLLISSFTVLYQLFFGADIQTLGVKFRSIEVPGGYMTTAQVAAVVIAIVVAFSLWAISKYSMIGKLAHVASQYPLGARSVGVPVDKIYLGVFVIAGLLAGLAGGVIMTFQPVEPTLGLQYITIVFLVALVARTHLLGCLALGIAYGVTQSVLSYLLDASIASTLTLVVFLAALVGGHAIRQVSAVARRVFGQRNAEVGLAQ